jgi:hypothetical protein
MRVEVVAEQLGWARRVHQLFRDQVLQADQLQLTVFSHLIDQRLRLVGRDGGVEQPGIQVVDTHSSRWVLEAPENVDGAPVAGCLRMAHLVELGCSLASLLDARLTTPGECRRGGHGQGEDRDHPYEPPHDGAPT